MLLLAYQNITSKHPSLNLQDAQADLIHTTVVLKQLWDMACYDRYFYVFAMDDVALTFASLVPHRPRRFWQASHQANKGSWWGIAAEPRRPLATHDELAPWITIILLPNWDLRIPFHYSVMASQISDNSTICSQLIQANSKDIKAPHCWSLGDRRANVQ